MMRKTYKMILFISMILCSFSGALMADHKIDSTERIRVQNEEYLPYDEWYGPDETVDTDEDSQSDREDVPEVPNNNTREAPVEDTRPQGR